VITVHPASHCTSFLQSGDQVAAPELPDAIPTEHWYMLNGVDVRVPASAAAVAALGDSITDGSGSKSNVNQRWPDYLARRLQKDSTTEQVGVLNLGIGGNRILNDGRGPNALARLDRDVLAQSGVRWLILFEGINDIGTYGGRDANPGQVPATAENLIAAFEQIIDRAHSQGIRVYGATILPMQGSFYFTPEKEVERQKVNGVSVSGSIAPPSTERAMCAATMVRGVRPKAFEKRTRSSVPPIDTCTIWRSVLPANPGGTGGMSRASAAIGAVAQVPTHARWSSPAGRPEHARLAMS
ncbi:MAG: GDSL-type esterase/lipase family protein, partial [Acidobacteriota bacterium]